MNFLQYWNKFLFHSGFQSAIETLLKFLLKNEETFCPIFVDIFFSQITTACLAVFNMYYKPHHICQSAHVIHCKLWIRNSLPVHNLEFSYINTWHLHQSRTYRTQYCCVIVWKPEVSLYNNISQDQTVKKDCPRTLETKTSVQDCEEHTEFL